MTPIALLNRRRPPATRRSLKHRVLFEPLEKRLALAFGLTTTTSSYTVDTGSQVVFSVSRTNGDLTSMKFNGTELEAPFSVANRYSHYESGLSSSTNVSAAIDPQGNWIKITCDDTSGVGVIQYYMARKGFNNIYMATYAASLPSPGEMRFITYTNHAVLTNAPAPSNISGGTAIEGSDVYQTPDGTTHSKFYGALRMIDDTYHGLTGANVGLFMNMGNRETSSGGPFFKDIDFQTTSSSVTELYNYMESGHTQTDAYRPGLQGPYALQFTNGSAPASIDYSFIDGLNLTGLVPASGRGNLVGNASGVPTGHEVTVALSNTTAQYWTHPDAVTGNYSINGVKPGTYTETLYQDELAVGTQTVTISACSTTAANITDTYYTPPAIWRIGIWDGTPAGFLNADKIATMHPSDPRMSPWTAPTFTIGTSTDNTWPLGQFKDVNNTPRIVFNLTAAQAATPLTLRIGITLAFAGGRPFITVNSGQSYAWTSSIPSPSNQPNSRGITRGTWRGNNTLFTYNIPTSALRAGTNTIDIVVASGSSGTAFLSPNITYDAIDLVTTSSLTNAPMVTTISVSPPNPNLPTGTQQAFTATARDQFGNVTPANFTWSAARGVVDGAGLYTAPGSVGSDLVTATSGTVNGNTTINVTYLKGDFNLDGVLNAADITAMFQAFADLSAYQVSRNLSANDLLTIGDLNGDGAITNLDLQPMLDAVAASSGSGSSASENVANASVASRNVIQDQAADHAANAIATSSAVSSTSAATQARISFPNVVVAVDQPADAISANLLFNKTLQSQQNVSLDAAALNRPARLAAIDDLFQRFGTRTPFRRAAVSGSALVLSDDEDAGLTTNNPLLGDFFGLHFGSATPDDSLTKSSG
jgi:rhamnogalacturonan endolyase